jgi:hypothetical protein
LEVLGRIAKEDCSTFKDLSNFSLHHKDEAYGFQECLAALENPLSDMGEDLKDHSTGGIPNIPSR